MIGSGAAHLILFGACLLLHPVTEDARAVLRVRLVEEARPPASVPIATDIKRSPAPMQFPSPRPRPRRVSPSSVPALDELSTPPVQRVEAESALPAVPPLVQPPLAADTPSSPVPTPATPPGPYAPTARVLESPGMLGGNRTSDEPSPRFPANEATILQPGGGSWSAAPTPTSEPEPRGAYMLSAPGNGSGTGVGSGTGDGFSPGRGAGTVPGGNGGGGGTAAGQGAAPGGAASVGAGAGAGDQLLRTIRSRIARVWTYPDAARRDGLEGTVWLRFRVGADGLVDAVEILRSSGHDLLDDDLARTVHRAAPYPAFAGWVRLPFTYRLER